MKCPKCGNFFAFSMIPYQRIHRDKKTGHWVPSAGICQCDPDDFALFGLIKEKNARDAREREKEATKYLEEKEEIA
jgi:hypothetical protein